MLTNGASVEVSRQNSLSSSDETSPYTPLVLELLLWLTVGWPVTCQPRQNDLCVFCRTYTSVESLALAGPIIRPSSSTIASLHDITGSFTSCYKSHRLQTRLRLLQNVVLSTVLFKMSFKVLPLPSRIPSLAVVPWRHHSVMILWLNSQRNRLRC